MIDAGDIKDGLAEPACAACRFFQPSDNPVGQCRRRSPSNPEGIFPEMAVTEWCGEFVPMGHARAIEPDPVRSAAAVVEQRMVNQARGVAYFRIKALATGRTLDIEDGDEVVVQLVRKKGHPGHVLKEGGS